MPAPSSPARNADVSRRDRPRTIFLAGPCGGKTGGMYQVSLYLQQASGDAEGAQARFRLLDTRGGSALVSPLHLLAAAGRITGARLAGRVAGVHIHIAERLSLVRKGLLVSLCKVLGVPVVLHLHAAELEQNYAAMPAVLRPLVRGLFRMPDCCIALGRRAADFLERGLGVPPQRVEIVTNGVPEPSLRAPRKAAGALQLLFVGNLSERKGVSVLLQALATGRLRDLPVRLTLAGGGDVEHYQRLAHTFGIGDRVRFTGWADKPAVERLLAGADVFVLPSFHEGLPLAILEAMSFGVPVVCTPVGEIPQVLVPGKSACFVPPGDAGALADALAQLAGDPQLRRQLSRGALDAYRARFSLAAFAEAVGAIHLRHFGATAIAEVRTGSRAALSPSPAAYEPESLAPATVW